MPTYRSISRDLTGAMRTSIQAAGNQEILTADLRSQGLLVLEVKEIGKRAAPTRPTLDPRTWLGMAGFDVEMGFQQLASMLRSGLSLLSAMRTVAEQARRPRAAAVWNNVADRIEQGSSFTSALTAHRRVFSEHTTQLVRVGETTGNLDTALHRAAEHLERTRQLKFTVFNALAYPIIVTVLAIGVAAFLVLGVIPKIEKYLGGRGRKLPPITQSLLDVSAFMQVALPYFAVGLAALTLALFFIHRWPPGRLILDRVLLRIPIIGGVLRLGGTAIFARGLGVLLESGVTLLESLKTVEHLLANRSLRARVTKARETILRGGTLAAPLAEARDFMPMLPRMVAVGESAGTLSQVLDEVARFHENQIVVVIRRMSVLIEPIVILVVGVIVGFVYIAFFVALFSLAGGSR